MKFINEEKIDCLRDKIYSVLCVSLVYFLIAYLNVLIRFENA